MAFFSPPVTNHLETLCHRPKITGCRIGAYAILFTPVGPRVSRFYRLPQSLTITSQLISLLTIMKANLHLHAICLKQAGIYGHKSAFVGCFRVALDVPLTCVRSGDSIVGVFRREGIQVKILLDARKSKLK